MGAGVAGSQHTEDDAEGHAVEAGTDEVVVGQDEEAKHTCVHEENRIAIGAGEIAAGAPEDFPVVLKAAPHKQGSHHKCTEEDDAEHINRHGRGHLQAICRGGSRKLHAHGLIQYGIQEESRHANGQGRAVQVKALVDLGRMTHARRKQEANKEAHSQSHENTREAEAHDLSVGVADQHIGDNGGNACGEQHGVDERTQLLLLHQAVDYHTQDCRQNVQHIDAPGTEAQCQNKSQGGHVIGGALKNAEQSQAYKARKAHIQEGCRIAAQGKIVGGDLTGLAQNGEETGQHGSPVRHQHRRRQECQAGHQEKQLQKRALG